MTPLLHPTMLVCVAAWLCTPAAQAQVFRSVDAAGNVTFSDRPTAVTEAAATVSGSSTDTTTDSNAALPYTLQQVQASYPVTLYSGPQCAPCDSGRALLQERGVPFTEKTVASSEDVKALQALTNTTNLPVLTLGQKQIEGYEQTNWTNYLDAAGYPKTSQLPADWQPAAPTPLATPAPGTVNSDTQVTAAEPDTATPSRTEPEAIDPVRTADNPAGIRF